MKKIVLILAIAAQSVFVFAEKPKKSVRVKNEDVKMYLQAGTSSPVVKTLSSTANIKFIRQYDEQWSVVKVNGRAGYVLTSELNFEEGQIPAVKAKSEKKKMTKNQ